jgi:hypothetical protein
LWIAGLAWLEANTLVGTAIGNELPRMFIYGSWRLPKTDWDSSGREKE